MRDDHGLLDVDDGAGPLDDRRVERGEIAAPQVGAAQPDVVQLRAGQIDASDGRAGEVGPGQVHLAHPHPGQPDAAQVGAGQRDEGPVTAVDRQRTQVALLEGAADQLAAGELGLEEVAPPEHATGEGGVDVPGGVEPTLPNVHPVKTAPRLTASVRSTSKNSQPTKCRSVNSSPYQSSLRKVTSSVSSGIRPG